MMSRILRSPLVWMSVLALGLMGPGCGGDGGSPSGPSTPAPTPVPTPTPIVYDGTWSGRTTQNNPITFVISGNRITQVRIGLRFQGGGCTVTLTTTITGSTPITNGTFTLIASGSSLDITLHGTFSSPTSLSGDGNGRYKSSSFCNGLRNSFTYTASK